jgi:cytochrome c biogenesis protein
MILGCYVTFFMFHQQYCIELSAQGNLTKVAVSGVSGKNQPGMLAKTRRLGKRLKKNSDHPEFR